MHDGDDGRRLRALIAGTALLLLGVPGASAGEWETLRESYDRALSTHGRRVAEIEARERGAVPDPGGRAEKLTRDRIAALRGAAKGTGKARDLADAAERASSDLGGVGELSAAHAVHVEIELKEWGGDGPARKRLRESTARLVRNLERASASLSGSVDVAVATADRIPESGAAEQIARLEAGVKDAGDRIRTKWLNQQAALERERVERQRAAAERERSLR
jgi:hypothetical protein